ncbi:flagellar filament capping protein FliD [Cytobacillus spongiae]|uniref:flagellar filament capping protein FliD n=1 Tax=Cytobacillus spongiae TaxID=2901381 RepID=UPI001F1D8104|nr:flagellar filament capping protein FliD [Cytobacillus spongiae]UII55608.1 flagellar filament capping protein FliD [Cytobacillus spongiae]
MSGLRITGLATGMDIDSIVKDMIRAESIPLDKILQKKQTLEWKRDSYREMNTLIQTLREDSLKMRLPSTYLTKVATSSNDSKISATADATAGTLSYSFTKVDRLASAATNASATPISGIDGKIDTKAKIYSIQSKFLNSSANFDWKTTDTDGVNETVKVSSASKVFKLSKLSGGTISSGSLDAGQTISVKDKDGNITDTFTITTNEEDLKSLSENQVYLNKSTGQMTFGKELQTDSSFDVPYKYIQKDTLSASSTQKEFQLSNVGINSTDGIKKITVTTYQKNEDGSIKIDSNGNSIIASTQNYTSFVNGANPGEFVSSDGKVTVDGNTGKVTFADDVEQGAKIEADYSYSYFEFDIKTHTSKGEVTESFKINGGDSFSTILSKISNSKLGISAFYDEYSDKVTMTRKETGDYHTNAYDPATGNLITQNHEIEFMGNNFLTNILNLNENQEKGGEDAKFTMNGLETGRHTNTFAVNGVTFTLKDTFQATDPTVSIGTKTDTDKVFDSIKSFIDKYNETIDKVNKKISEDRYREYQPLTAEQRESLSEKEVEMWEEKAKSGLLRRDQNLSGLLDKMRSDFYAKVDFEGDSPYKQLATIGITTTNLYNVNKGKLEIDEAKLKEAINNDPDAVYKLFANDSDNYSEKGIARRLRDSMTNAIVAIEETAGNDVKTNDQFTIGKNLNDIEDRVSDFERKLKEAEERYYRQFSAMEQAVQKMNQQSSYLMSQLGMAQQQ